MSRKAVAVTKNKKPIKIEKEQESDNVQVFVRARPVLPHESSGPYKNAVRVNPPNSLDLIDRNNNVRSYNFAGVFPPSSGQLDVYKAVAVPRLEEMLKGYNCIIFAYGQTGTGKTFTMEGRAQRDTRWDAPSNAGLIPRVLQHLFEKLDCMRIEDSEAEYSVSVSYIELYNEKLHDLLSSNYKEIKIRALNKDTDVLEGVEEVPVDKIEAVYGVLDNAHTRRTAATNMNANSSRSHCVFTITTHIKTRNEDGEEVLTVGKLYLVDLAGSENIGRSGATSQRAVEAGNINKSLLALGRVITALTVKSSYIPYRDGMLTRLLRDGLGGKAKTSIIATLSPTDTNYEESLSTCDYAHSAQSITNRPEKNKALPRKELISELNERIRKLLLDLRSARAQHGIYLSQETYDEMMHKLENQNQANETLGSNVEVLTEQLNEIKREVSEVRSECIEAKRAKKDMENEKLVLQNAYAKLEEKLAYANKEIELKDYTIEVMMEVESSLRGESKLLNTKIEEKELEGDKLRVKINNLSSHEGKLVNSVRNTEKKMMSDCMSFRDSVTDLSKNNAKFVEQLKVEVGVKFGQEVAPFLKDIEKMTVAIYATFNDLCSSVLNDTIAHTQSQSSIRNSIDEESMAQKLEVMVKNESVHQSFAILLEEIKKLMNSFNEGKAVLSSKIDLCSQKMDDALAGNLKSFQFLQNSLENSFAEFSQLTSNLNSYFKVTTEERKTSNLKAHTDLKTEIMKLLDNHRKVEEDSYSILDNEVNLKIANIDARSVKNSSQIKSAVEAKIEECNTLHSNCTSELKEMVAFHTTNSDNVLLQVADVHKQISSTKSVTEEKENNIFKHTTDFLTAATKVKSDSLLEDNKFVQSTKDRMQLEKENGEKSQTSSNEVIKSFDEGIESTVTGVKDILSNFSSKLQDGLTMFQEEFKNIEVNVDSLQQEVQSSVPTGQTPKKQPLIVPEPTPAIWEPEERRMKLKLLQAFKVTADGEAEITAEDNAEIEMDADAAKNENTGDEPAVPPSINDNAKIEEAKGDSPPLENEKSVKRNKSTVENDENHDSTNITTQSKRFKTTQVADKATINKRPKSKMRAPTARQAKPTTTRERHSRR